MFDAAAMDRWGHVYDYYFRGWLPASRDERIVDLACGGGSLLRFFYQRGFRDLRGVDISPDQVARAKKVFAKVTEMNVLKFLREQAGSFGLITALDLIEHLDKDEVLAFLDECHRALRPGGRLILQTPNAESPWFGAVRYGDFTHELCFTVNNLSRLMTVTGFRQSAAREVGPISFGLSLTNTIRASAWQVIRLGLKAWNIIETGRPGSGVFTRNFLMSAIK